MPKDISQPENKSATDHAVVMPCPRLEFRWVKESESWYERECVYSLVIPLRELDIRSTDVEGTPRELSLEIGRTRVTGGSGEAPIHEGKVDTPFRDHSHAIWDREALGNHLPIVAVCEDISTLVELRPASA